MPTRGDVSSARQAPVTGLAVALTVALGASCATLPRLAPDVQAQLAAHPGAWVHGAPAGLHPPQVLNREDFVYDARPSPDGRVVAFARLGMKEFALSGWERSAPPKKRFDVPMVPLEFDVEALDFSPDGQVVATACRDGVVRAFSAADGALLASWPTEEPLVSLAFHPGGHALAVGSARGLVTVLGWPGLGFLAEARAHADEVRGLAFAPDGTLFSGGWDKQVAAWTMTAEAAPATQTRVHIEAKAGLQLVRGVFDARAAASCTVDARYPGVVVKAALAQTLGVEPALLKESTTLQAASGAQVAKLVHGRTLTFKGLSLTDLDVAVCDACVPAEAQAVLGQAVLDRVDVATDGATHELVLTVKAGAPGVKSASGQSLAEARRFVLPAFVNDLSLDAKGARLAVALSEAKAVRTYETYQREKRGEVEPERPWDVGALVDAATGKVLDVARGHHGVVATAAVSPDGVVLATGGWDHRVRLAGAGPAGEQKYGLAVRRVRFTRDGTALVVAAWTPQNPLGDHQSDPAVTVSDVAWRDPAVQSP